MLRMQPFAVHTPRTIAEAVALRASLPGSLYVAGGTDLLPNLKHGLHRPDDLVSLSAIDELRGLSREEDGTVRIGAGVVLHTVATSALVRATVPALASAAARIAGPQHRRMGTLGGNIMLDTRCLFYNQSRPWRESLGYCLKKDGDWCHVIGSKATCVAAQSSDTVPVLTALGAVIEVETPDGPTEVSLAKLYTQDGRLEKVHALPAASLVRAVRIPPQAPGHRSVYRKVRAREAVDYPQLGVALIGTFDSPESGATCTALSIVVGALLPKPRVLRKLEAAVGTYLPDAVIDAMAEAAFKQVRPQVSIHGAQDWRRALVRVEVRRGLEALRDDPATRAVTP